MEGMRKGKGERRKKRGGREGERKEGRGGEGGLATYAFP